MKKKDDDYLNHPLLQGGNHLVDLEAALGLQESAYQKKERELATLRRKAPRIPSKDLEEITKMLAHINDKYVGKPIDIVHGKLDVLIRECNEVAEILKSKGFRVGLSFNWQTDTMSESVRMTDPDKLPLSQNLMVRPVFDIDYDNLDRKIEKMEEVIHEREARRSKGDSYFDRDNPMWKSDILQTKGNPLKKGKSKNKKKGKK